MYRAAVGEEFVFDPAVYERGCFLHLFGFPEAEAGEVPDLGHRWPGVVQVSHVDVLPGCVGCGARVRRDARCYVRGHEVLVLLTKISESELLRRLGCEQNGRPRPFNFVARGGAARPFFGVFIF